RLSESDAAALSSAINPGRWQVGDIPLLDELAHLLGPAPATDDAEPLFLPDGMAEVVTLTERLTDTRAPESGVPHETYAHILVDEAQDITPMQWRMLQRRGAGASWTIVGDPAQSSWPDPAESGRAVTHMVGSRPHREFRLSTNYRSPKEAYDLATAYIRSVDPLTDIPEAVRSTGVRPRVVVASPADVGAVVADEVTRLLAELDGTVGVLAGDPAAVATALPADPRVVLLDPVSAKGLEFDGVVVVDPDGIVGAEASGARTLYVGLTRPTQALVVVDVGHAGQWRTGLEGRYWTV
ncbi:MAG: ATP-binding domain-containing protein, partial [Propionibacteriaceae bacterium]|nr:ATP-binding domain-containing protein [Propionibacteriaceae bacterium]